MDKCVIVDHIRKSSGIKIPMVPSLKDKLEMIRHISHNNIKLLWQLRDITLKSIHSTIKKLRDSPHCTEKFMEFFYSWDHDCCFLLSLKSSDIDRFFYWLEYIEKNYPDVPSYTPHFQSKILNPGIYRISLDKISSLQVLSTSILLPNRFLRKLLKDSSIGDKLRIFRVIQDLYIAQLSRVFIENYLPHTLESGDAGYIKITFDGSIGVIYIDNEIDFRINDFKLAKTVRSLLQ